MSRNKLLLKKGAYNDTIVDIHLYIKFVQTLEHWSSFNRKRESKFVLKEKCLKTHMKDTTLIPILLKPFLKRQLFCTAAEPDPVH